MPINHNAVVGPPSALPGRPRGTDPTTSDRYYSDGEFEFLSAVTEYKQNTGRKFLNLSEYYRIMVEHLGYTRDASPAKVVLRTRTCSVA